MIKSVVAIAMTLAAMPAYAQSGATQTPPSPNASSSAPTPATSVPPGATSLNPGSSRNPNPAGPVGATGPTTAAPGAAGSPSGAFQKTVPQPASK